MTTTKSLPPELANNWLRRWREAGLIPPRTRKVIIELCIDGPATLFIEQLGDSKQCEAVQEVLSMVRDEPKESDTCRPT